MSLFELLYALWLGILQGITEFLPISSSGHLIVSSWLVKGDPLSLEMNVALHFGTALAVLIYFHKDWRAIAFQTFRWIFYREKSFESQVLIPAIFIGSIPAGILGILFEKKIELYFHNPLSVAGPLVVVGILLWWSDKRSPQDKDLSQLSIVNALMIGIAQACALIPGVSRSGATILTARYLGFDRVSAAKFSFLLGTPVVVGASLMKAPSIFSQSINHSEFYVGVAASFVAGISTIHFLLLFLQRFSFVWFAIYRCLLAALIVFLYFTKAS